MEPVTIELTAEDLKAKTDSEKLDILVGISFATHEQVIEQREILTGNGNPKNGLIHKVAFLESVLTWAVGGVGFTAIVAVAIKLIWK